MYDKMTHKIPFARRLRSLYVLLILLAWSPSVVSAAEVVTIDHARYLGRDGPELLGRNVDDSSWREISLPCAPSQCDLTTEGDVALYRLKFHVPKEADLGGWAFSRGRVWGAEELYLNGTRVGTTGRVARRFAQVWAKPRVYSLPAEFLVRGENVLTLRAMNLGVPFGPAFDKVSVAPESVARATSSERFHTRLVLQAGTIALSAAAVLALLLMMFVGGVRTRPLYVVLLISSASLASWILTAPWLRVSPLTTTFETINYSCFVAIGVAALPYVIAERYQKTVSWLSLFYVLATLVPLALAFSPETIAYVSTLQVIYALPLGLHGNWLLASKSWARRDQTLGVVAVGMVAAGAVTVVGIASPSTAAYPLSEIAQCLFVVALMHLALRTFIERTRRVAMLQRKVIETADDERGKLARELHDGVGQDLQAARMSLQLVARSSQEMSEDVRDLIAENVRNLGQSLDHIRALSRELHPGFAGQLPLRARLGRYTDQLSQLTARSVRLRWHGEDDPLSPDASTNLFRAVQEAVGNALRHGDDTVVDVKVDVDRDSIRIAVTGGPMFVPGEGTGVGWVTLQERADLLGGSVEVVEANRRACVLLRAPVRTPSANERVAGCRTCGSILN